MYKSKSFYIFLISGISFFILNLIEDLIQFNIGRNRQLTETKVYLPEKVEWFYVIIVMIIFAILQGLITYYFDVNL
jgi:hypothetical protein